jgi:hypothetical protein
MAYIHLLFLKNIRHIVASNKKMDTFFLQNTDTCNNLNLNFNTLEPIEFLMLISHFLNKNNENTDVKNYTLTLINDITNSDFDKIMPLLQYYDEKYNSKFHLIG